MTISGRYVARIRWRSAANANWEVDTRHTGFESWREAACFANGLSEEGASSLWLRHGTLVLELVNGRDEIVDASDAIVWHRAKRTTLAVPEDMMFVRATADLRALIAIGLDGAFKAIRFGVDDLSGLSRLDVRVGTDVRRRMVIVTLASGNDDRVRDSHESTDAFFEVACA